MQLILGSVIGGTFRVVDINDVIFNTLGVAVGYVVFLGFLRIFYLVLEKYNLSQNPIFSYIIEKLIKNKRVKINKGGGFFEEKSPPFFLSLPTTTKKYKFIF